MLVVYGEDGVSHGGFDVEVNGVIWMMITQLWGEDVVNKVGVTVVKIYRVWVLFGRMEDEVSGWMVCGLCILM